MGPDRKRVAMPKETDSAFPMLTLRYRAEEKFKSEQLHIDFPPSEEELLKLVHEYHVHQIELEMQNEELRRSEEELTASRDKFSLLYDFAPMGYLTVDQKGEILTVNLTGARILGTERSRLLKQSFRNFIAESDRQEFSGFLHQVFQSKVKQTCEVQLWDVGSQPLFVRIEAVAADPGEECLAAIVDITALRLMAKELQQSVDDLQQEIARRKMLEQQVMQSQKMEAIGQLARGVAHDFNNLLTAIAGYGEEIRDGLPAGDDHLRECVLQLLQGTERAAELTRRLLAFSRKQHIEQELVPIDDVVASVCQLIERVLGEDVELVTEFCCKGTYAMAATGQIEQVLLNLAANAREAMPDGGRLSIITRQMTVANGDEVQFDLPSPGRYITIAVSDSGTGIRKEIIDRIFEPFFTTKEVGKGTGLGLSMAHGILKQHNGSIQVTSESGKGTTFEIYIPVSEEQVTEKNIQTPVTFCSGTETLLVVEDEEIVKLYLKKTFEKAGYRVLVAGDGDEALKLFREYEDISLVLSDVVMPGKNGKELFAELRQIKPGMKVIFMSGYTANVLDLKGIKEEGLELITKPFSKNELLWRVREVLDRR
jgi:PAS domain S-box-containing protein